MPTMRGRGRGRGRGASTTPLSKAAGGRRTKGSKKKNNIADPFFEPQAKRRRDSAVDDVIDSDDSGEERERERDDSVMDDGDDRRHRKAPQDEEDEEETAAEKKYRIAKQQLEKVRALTRKLQEEEDGIGEHGDDDDEEGEDRRGRTDARVADLLQKEQLEKSGRSRRLLAHRILKPEASDEFRILQRHRQSVTAIALSGDDSRGFSASKDGMIVHWDVESGARDKYRWPNDDSGSSGDGKKQSKHVLALAVSSDGRYLASGGLDRAVHLWDTRTRAHLQAFRGHKAPVSCLTFREGSSDLFSGSFDNTVKWWNADDRTHLGNLFGHEAEILTIDCLRKEKVLTVGRDRTMRLFKIIETVHSRYSSPSALECGCFINNEEFLSGSDDGSIELWSVLRKKPAYIMKNAHSGCDPLHSNEGGVLSNGVSRELGYQASSSLAQSWVSSVTVCKGSDLAASGAGNGVVRLWEIESDPISIKPLYDLPLAGFVNSLAFARSGRFLLAGVGQEPRLGRWGRVEGTQNGVALFPLKLSTEKLHF